MKAGAVADTFLIVTLVVVFAMSIIFSFMILSEINAQLALHSSVNESVGLNISENVESSMLSFDMLFPLLFVGLNLGAIFTSFLVRVHPVFLIFTLLIIAIAILYTAIFANVYAEISSAEQIANYSTEFGITNVIMSNLVAFQTIFVFLDTIVLYSSFGFSRGGPTTEV